MQHIPPNISQMFKASLVPNRVQLRVGYSKANCNVATWFWSLVYQARPSLTLQKSERGSSLIDYLELCLLSMQQCHLESHEQ